MVTTSSEWAAWLHDRNPYSVTTNANDLLRAGNRDKPKREKKKPKKDKK
jgi:hypothetical protein